MKYQTYEKYKDSGVEWIGRIPEFWSLIRLKFILDYQKGKNPKELSTIQNENSIIYLTMDYLRGNPKQIFYAERSENCFQVDDNELLLLWDGSNAGEFILSKSGILSSTMAVIYLKGISKKFAWFFFKHFEIQLKKATIGMGVPHVNGQELKNGSISLPPLPEQLSIAAFLDRETARIDALIDKKQKLIALLKEKRTALITRAVTKGLNPNAKMKESGIEWLGEIPAHWEVKRLKYVVTMRSGENITSTNIEPQGTYSVFGGNGKRGYCDSFTHEGTYVLIGRQGALCGNINYADGKFWASEHAVVVKPKAELNTFWLGELLRAMNLNQYSLASAQPGLSVDRILYLQVPVPPVKEQDQISKYLKEKFSKMDKLSNLNLKAIDKLQEYRTALISAAVTGKVRVFDPNEQK